MNPWTSGPGNGVPGTFVEVLRLRLHGEHPQTKGQFVVVVCLILPAEEVHWLEGWLVTSGLPIRYLLGELFTFTCKSVYTPVYALP